MSSKNKNSPIRAAILIFFFRLFARLPDFVRQFFGRLLAVVSYHVSTKTRSTIERNLQLCFPELSASERKKLVKENFKENASLALELPVAWLGSREKIVSQIKHVNDRNLIETIVSQQQPVIVAVPHIGNWEFFWHWLQLNYQILGMYSPASIPQVDQLMLESRCRFGGEALATDPKGIMKLLRGLKQGKLMMILPDQAPKTGSGVYTPFFNQNAYTMTLLHRFIQKTDAKLLFGTCLRRADKGFDIDIYSANFEITNGSVETFNLAMNQQLEQIIRLAPAQYQWSYKRFKRQPDGLNLYRQY